MAVFDKDQVGQSTAKKKITVNDVKVGSKTKAGATATGELTVKAAAAPRNPLAGTAYTAAKAAATGSAAKPTNQVALSALPKILSTSTLADQDKVQSENTIAKIKTIYPTKITTGTTSTGSTGSTKSSGSSGSSGGGSGSTGTGTAATGYSPYYNTRGDLATKYQNYLNTLGAGLTVDGIWGKNTEAAYQTYKNAFDNWIASGMQSPTAQGTTATQTGYNPTAGTMAGINPEQFMALLSTFQTKYQGRDDAELRQAALDQAQAQYEADALAAQQQNERYQQSVRDQLADLLSQYGMQRSELSDQYAKQNNQVQRMLTERGMGRSTYAGDMAQNTNQQLNKALDQYAQQYNQQRQQLTGQAATYAQQTADTLNQLLKNRAANINTAYNQLYESEAARRQANQQEQNAIVQNLLSMLSNRNLTEQQLAEQIRQFNAQLGENTRQFNAQMALR